MSHEPQPPQPGWSAPAGQGWQPNNTPVPPYPHGSEPPRAPARHRGETRRKLPFVLGGVGAVLMFCLGGTVVTAFSSERARTDIAAGYPPGAASHGSEQTEAPDTSSARTSVAPATSKPVGATTPPSALPTARAAQLASSAKPAKTTTATIKVPNGVGMDYQSAQDLWRSAGLVVAPAVDATGAHRLPIIDSNWVVLSQDLKAGSQVADPSVITATVRKYSDD